MKFLFDEASVRSLIELEGRVVNDIADSKGAKKEKEVS